LLYGALCESFGANPAHPEWWTAPQRAAYRAGRLAAFRAHWRRMMELDHPAIIRAQHGRTALINDVRLDLARALAAPPSRPWAHCRCHRMRHVTARITPEPPDAIDDEDLAVWRARDRTARAGIARPVAVALAYLDTFAPRTIP
jgi:hypothetical protein